MKVRLRRLWPLLGLTAFVFSGCASFEDPPGGAPPGDEVTGETEAAITTPDDTNPIDPPPHDLTVQSVAPDDFHFSFACGTHATNHEIFRQTDGGAPVSIATYAACQATFTLNYHDTTVEPARTYCYWVVASNSVYSAATDKICQATPLDYSPLALPTGYLTDIRMNRASLMFRDQSTNESGFRVYFRQGTGAYSLVQTFVRATRADHATGDYFNVERINLTPDTQYQFKVEVYHDYAPLSAEVEFPAFRTLPLAPTAPTNLRVMVMGENSMSLAWTDALYEDHYNIVKTEGFGGDNQTVPANETSTTITGLQSGTRYCYKVVAENASGTAETAPVCATTAGSQTYDVYLDAVPSPTGGFLLYQGRIGPITNNVINSVELRSAVNATSSGFLLIPPTSTSGADCDSSSKAVFIPLGGSTTSDDLTKIFGGSHPSLAGAVLLQGCPTFASTIPPTFRPVLTVHFGPASPAPPPPATAPPTAPGNVHQVDGAVLDSSVQIAWTDSQGEDSYSINEVSGSGLPSVSAPQNAKSAIISNLSPSSTYCFQVVAKNSAGSTPGAEVCVTTSGLPAE